jgi:hypothetical protein
MAGPRLQLLKGKIAPTASASKIVHRNSEKKSKFSCRNLAMA